jgi:putative ABC transport system substrate-binding protein
MRKGAVLATLSLGLFLVPLPVPAQPTGSVPRVGILWIAGRPDVRDNHEAFRQGLGDLGYVDGRSVIIEARYADNRSDRLGALVADIIRSRVDVLVTPSSLATLAAKEATTTIPIVMANVYDPVGLGFVASLARPGGRITGVSNLAEDLSAKSLEVVKDAIPGLSRVAMLANSTNPAAKATHQAMQAGARALGLTLHILDVQTPSDLDTALAEVTKQRTGALLVGSGGGEPLFNTYRTLILDFATRHRLPTMYSNSVYVRAGGFMSYGPNVFEMFRHAAIYVDKILKGAKPADLPVEQPTKFELVINLKTAKALGLTIPPSVLARADEVIE